MFDHFILTRYNLYLYQTNPYNIQDKDAWMKSRVPLFKRFLKSLEEQTVNNFTLILSVDAETPENFFNDLIKTLDKSTVRYVIELNNQPKVYVQNRINEKPFIITSRCDSDDTLEPEFIEVIQKNFNQVEECLDTRGLQHDGKDYYTYQRDEPGSPFISLIETNQGEIKTASFKQHAKMIRYFFSRFVGSKPLFVQHVHGGNIINSIKGEKI